uniref:GI homologue n=1 Tax=Lemna gibba TaxID=4470 RepID=Q50K77_LEMGI|nr:GI homologue [Lemna gibba]
MPSSTERWIDGLQFPSLFWPPPQDEQQRQAQTTAYVEYFVQFTSERFPEDVAQLIQNHYPSKESRLLDEVLATFVLHHPEHGHAIVHPTLSCIIEGSLVYSKNVPPFNSFISLVSQNNEKEYSEQWALACGEILRVLTHYNRPIYKVDHQGSEEESRSEGESSRSPKQENERKPLRPLSAWITDILLAAPLGIRSDYFRWCGGVMGKYAAGGELKPPITASSRGAGKHPQLMPSTPRWAVANGAGVILSVCDEEVARHETANLTAAAVPALLLPPPTTPLDEHLVAGLPPLEPYARLFHRYYAIATPSATQRLLLGLLEAPPSWAPDALDAAVQLVELLRAAEDYATGMRLPRNWMHLHFLRAIGTAMSMRAGIAADAAAALLFRVLSQPTLLFPPPRQSERLDILHDQNKQVESSSSDEATTEATAQGIASLLCAHGPDVEWRICTIWEAAYGLLPLSSSAVDLPEIVVASPLQPPPLSWNLYLPLIKVLEYLPRGSPSEACLMRIFVATVEAILRRTFPPESPSDKTTKSRTLAVAELRTMIHSLFLESGASMDLASRLLFVVLTVCMSHEALPNGSKRPTGEEDEEQQQQQQPQQVKTLKAGRARKKQGPVATFDSYVLAAVCALACELQLVPFIAKSSGKSSSDMENGLGSAVHHSRRMLGILEALFSLKPSSVGTSWGYSSNEIVAAAMVAAHVSDLFGRSKAITNALSVLMRCKWDKEICGRASSLYHLIDIHGKTVASMVDKAPLWKDSISHVSLLSSSTEKKSENFSAGRSFEHGGPSTSNPSGESSGFRRDQNSSGKRIKSLMEDASDLANFLTADRHIGFNCSIQALLRSAFAEKHELCFSVVSLLWRRLIAAPETQMSPEGTSAQQGWRQVVDAMCNVVAASPTKASTAIVLQAEKDLQPWIARDDEQSQKLWRVNQRIVKLMAELMRSHDSPEALIILASASDLLLRATDGMLVDGEACTLPQLELLEVTARAVQLVIYWGDSGLAAADGLSNLLKCQLPATIRCLSHPSAHVRALSTAVLRDILNSAPMRVKNSGGGGGGHGEEVHSSPQKYSRCLNQAAIDWQADIQKWLLWELHSRRATGLTLSFLHHAAKELGCTTSASC